LWRAIRTRASLTSRPCSGISSALGASGLFHAFIQALVRRRAGLPLSERLIIVSAEVAA
jgi:hypothetical protein